jgi:hypothetical protein
VLCSRCLYNILFLPRLSSTTFSRLIDSHNTFTSDPPYPNKPYSNNTRSPFFIFPELFKHDFSVSTAQCILLDTLEALKRKIALNYNKDVGRFIQTTGELTDLADSTSSQASSTSKTLQKDTPKEEIKQKLPLADLNIANPPKHPRYNTAPVLATLGALPWRSDTVSAKLFDDPMFSKNPAWYYIQHSDERTQSASSLRRWLPST